MQDVKLIAGCVGGHVDLITPDSVRSQAEVVMTSLASLMIGRFVQSCRYNGTGDSVPCVAAGGLRTFAGE